MYSSFIKYDGSDDSKDRISKLIDILNVEYDGRFNFKMSIDDNRVSIFQISDYNSTDFVAYINDYVYF